MSSKEGRIVQRFGPQIGGWLSDRIGAERVLRITFTAIIVLGIALALTYKHMVPLTITCLTSAIALGLGTGAVFKLVAQWFPSDVGPVTGVVGAAGGLGGFFPLLMAIVKSLTGSYALGFILLAAVAAMCLIVLAAIDRAVPKSSPNLGPKDPNPPSRRRETRRPRPRLHATANPPHDGVPPCNAQASSPHSHASTTSPWKSPCA